MGNAFENIHEILFTGFRVLRFDGLVLAALSIHAILENQISGNTKGRVPAFIRTAV